jgi:Tol biopolymer transport system component
MSAALRDVGLETLPSLLDVADTAPQAEVIRRELAVLWLNVTSGRLNRATEVSFPALPGVRTVGDLIAEFEKTLVEGRSPGTLMSTSKQLVAGQGVSQSVCARLLYQSGTAMRESIQTDRGVIDRDVPIPRIPTGVATSISPDYSKIVIMTAWTDTAGGPVYVYDLRTMKLINLNQELGLAADHFSPGGVSVVGWHPDGQHLLIGPNDAGGVYWINLANNTFQAIRLTGSGGMGGRDLVDLSPDGNGFVYVTGYADNDQNQRLDYYDLHSGKITTLFTFPFGEGGLHFPRFSPTGNSVAYLTEKGHPTTGLTQTIRVFDLNTKSNKVLIEGALSRTEPVWSPDGQMIAFAWKDSVLPNGHWSPDSETWRGNIWVIHVPSGKAQQVTFIQGAARQPTWSPDGRLLAFLTHDGHIGLTSLEQPGVIWKAAASSADMPLFTSVFSLP